MNHSVNCYGYSPGHRAAKYISTPLLTLINAANPIDFLDPFLSMLGQVEIQSFALGDEICQFHEQGNLPDPAVFYIVCSGAVRLLCTERSDIRKLTVDLLGPGCSFGLDCLFCCYPLAYEAIAATPCQIAAIPFHKLSALLQQIPQLKHHLTQQVQQREQLIFFRSLTQFCSMSSQQLKSTLLPQLVEQQILAGTLIRHVTSAQSGQFWLRHGKLTSDEETVPGIGESWGCLGRNPTDWIAQTDLVLYEMPRSQIEAVSFETLCRLQWQQDT